MTYLYCKYKIVVIEEVCVVEFFVSTIRESTALEGPIVGDFLSNLEKICQMIIVQYKELAIAQKGQISCKVQRY